MPSKDEVGKALVGKRVRKVGGRRYRGREGQVVGVRDWPVQPSSVAPYVWVMGLVPGSPRASISVCYINLELVGDDIPRIGHLCNSGSLGARFRYLEGGIPTGSVYRVITADAETVTYESEGPSVRTWTARPGNRFWEQQIELCGRAGED